MFWQQGNDPEQQQFHDALLHLCDYQPNEEDWQLFGSGKTLLLRKDSFLVQSFVCFPDNRMFSWLLLVYLLSNVLLHVLLSTVLKLLLKRLMAESQRSFLQKVHILQQLDWLMDHKDFVQFQSKKKFASSGLC